MNKNVTSFFAIPKQFFAIGILISTLMLLGCGDGGNTQLITIDNPTNSKMVILYDDEKLEIPALGYIEKEMVFGEHSFSFLEGEFESSINQKKLPFKLYPSPPKVKLVINPSSIPYVVTSEYYGTGSMPSSKITNIEGYAYDDDATVIPNFSFTMIHDIGIHEPFPDEIQTSNSYQRVTKVFRFPDYDKYYREIWLGEPQKTTEPNSKTISYSSFMDIEDPLPTQFDLMRFNDRPEVKAVVEKYAQTTLEYLNTFESRDKSKDKFWEASHIRDDLNKMAGFTYSDDVYLLNNIGNHFYNGFVFFEPTAF